MSTYKKLLFLLLITINLKSHASGGPDDYGYTWLDSNDSGGPIYSWIDISDIGTEILGLGDDDSVPKVAMGLSFGYYWINFTEIKIGSNGWLSFNDVDNLASCFDNIPTAGGNADNYLAPFLADLTFAGVNNPGKVYYYQDVVNNNFIVSFLNVPYFKNNANRYIGSNTFQAIFSADDKSITFQYKDIDQENFETNSCSTNLVIGMENVTGDIGLETHDNVLPTDNYALKFYFPDVPLIDVIDPAPNWNQNTANTATLHEANQDINLAVNIANLGNADTLSPVNVQVEVLSDSHVVVYSEALQINQLLAQQEHTLNLVNPLNVGTGRYQLRVSTVLEDDMVLSNNQLSTELNVVDTSMATLLLGHTIGTPNSSISTYRFATFFNKPSGNWVIDSVTMYVRDSHLPGSEDYRVSVYANDGGDNLPGTLLATELVKEGTYSTFSWVNTQLSEPVIAPENGFFVAWENANESSSGVGIGIESLLPLSRLTYDYNSSGAWSVSRRNQTHDLPIEVELSTYELPDIIFMNGF